MRRTCLLFVVCSFTLALTAGEIPAQDSSSGIIFTGCPEAVQGSHCDSMFFQVVAVDLSTGKQCPEMKYILVDGPGEINEKTGLWQFHPEKEDLDWDQPGKVWTDEVEIAAHKGNDTTTSEENCRFPIFIRDHSPVLVGGNYQQLRISVGDTLAVPLTLTDEDWCDQPQVDSVRFADSAFGFFSYDPGSQIVTFVPDSADAGKHFDVYITVSSGKLTRHCTLHISVAAILPTYVVRLGYKPDQIQGQYCDIPITLTEFDTQQGMSGFDFLVGYDASALLFQLAYEGDLYTECAWEYFTYRYGAEGNCDSTCPSGLLRIIGLAETNNGSLHPGCNYPGPGYVSSAPVTLAFLRFLVSNDRTVEGAFLPIRFFWIECGDNMISNYTLTHLYISHEVFDGGELRISDTSIFPTYKGSQDECVIEDADNNRYVLRAVDFHNGGIDIIGVDSILQLGDINQNQIRYEIADAVMFSNYFVYGLSSFDSHVDQSVFASDVTMDRHYLTVEDLVYLIGVIIGDALPDQPGPPPSPNVAAFFWDQSINRVVSFSTPDTLGAICLVAQGEFTPYLLAPQMEMKYAVDSGLTRILVWSLDGHAMTSGNILAIPGATEIISIETATHYGRMVTTSLEIIDEPTPAPYAVRIGTAHDYPPGSLVDFPITLLRFDSTQGLAGFDLLLGYNASHLAFQLASEGDLYDECAWEYFTYRYGMEGNCTNCPTGMLRILGLAETNNGDIHPGCNWNDVGYVASAPVTLANLHFLISNAFELGDTWVPLSFLWVDCGDNMLSNSDGSDALLSSSVYDVGEQDISGTEAFPTYKGAQDECLFENPSSGHRALRGVDFINGGVEVFRPDTVGCDGDINLNGLPFEIADALLMSNYFHLVYEGPGSPETELCIDVNQDGQNSIADFVWLPLVIIGDILPDPAPPSPNPAAFVWDKATGVVSVSTYDTLGAVYMFVEGDVAPISLSGEHSVTVTQNGLTRILIYSGVGTTAIMSGPVEGIPGATGIVEIQAATYDGRAVTTSLEIIGEDTTAAYIVRIGHFSDADKKQQVDIPVTLETADFTKGLAAFDFLIGYDATALSFQYAQPGDLYDSCEWEYFTYRYGPNDSCGTSCPSGLVRLVGLAEGDIDLHHPSESCATEGPGWIPSLPVTLAELRFLTADDRTLECQGIPLRFYWTSCSDNLLVNTNGQETFVSAAVIEYDEYNISGVEAFPTYRGAQDQCVNDNPPARRIRRVDYYNGWVDFLCDFPVETHGDINLNGIAYEIADAIMFRNYFLQGLEAFGTHVGESVAQTDVNNDGIMLALGDLVFLTRVILGESPQGPLPDGDCLDATLRIRNDTLFMETLDSAGAAHIVLDGTVTPTLLAFGTEMQYNVVHSDVGQVQTRILIHSLAPGNGFGAGPIVAFEGVYEIRASEFANYFGLPCDKDVTIVEEVGDPTTPVEYALHGNYPNPFNPVTTIAYDLPERADVVLTVYNVVGQIVCTLVDRAEAAGRHEVFWDGRDESGQTVSSGIYLYRITAGDFTQSRKMLLLK